MGAMLFEASENYINPSRVSPLNLTSRVSLGSSQTQRLYVGDRVAVCVSAVCVTESCVFAPKNIGLRSDRQRKSPYGVFHDYDWQGFAALACLVFSERVLYTQMIGQSISFQTMIDLAAVFDFYTNLNEFYGVLTEFCTQQNCPTMSAGATYVRRLQTFPR